MTLADYITANLRKPFAWGTFDCVSFAAGWLEIKTGINHLAGLPAWSSEEEARRAIRSAGGLDKAISARLVRIHPNLAQDGAIGRSGRSVGIFSGPHLVIPGHDGLVFVDRTEAKCAWQS